MNLVNFSLLLALFTLISTGVSARELTAIEKECTRVGNKLGSVGIKECLDIKLIVHESISVNNAGLLIKEYPPLPRRQPMGRVLLLGGIHGDEYSSVSVVFKWLKTLDKHHSGLFHWKIAPLVNPDGLLQKKSSRLNANGVDLNRNFPVPDWSESAIKHWVEKTKRSPRRYPGEKALSEPETRWLVDEINHFKPDVLVSVHAPHGIVDYDGPEQAPRKLGGLYLNLLGTYPGSLGRYAGVDLGIPVITIELPYSGIMPKPDEISEIWSDLVSYLMKNMQQQELSTER